MTKCDTDLFENPDFLAGGVTGLLTSRFVFGVPAVLATQADSSLPLRPYHSGLLAHMVYKVTKHPFIGGLSTSLLIMEGASENPFGLGLTPDKAFLSYLITMGLVGAIAVEDWLL